MLREDVTEEEKTFILEKASTTFNTAMGKEPEDSDDGENDY